jgi:hypothetical protein
MPASQRKRSVRSPGGRKKASRPAAPAVERQLEAADLQQVVINLALEVATARVRHRALLTILERHMVLDFDEYVDAVVDVRERDGFPLYMALMLDRDDFREHFMDWNKEDALRWSRGTPLERRAPSNMSVGRKRKKSEP